MKYYYSKKHKGIFRYFQHNKNHYGFRLTYYDGNHKRHEKSKRGFSNLKSALNTYNDIKAIKDHENKNLTIKMWCKHYLHTIKPPVRKVTTYYSYKNLLSENIIPIIGNYKLNDITLDVYQDQCINHLLRKGLSRNTVVETNTRLQAVMNYAVKSRRIKSNPIKFADVPKINIRPRREIMNNQQLKQFHNVLDKHSLQCKVIFYTLEYTGMRAGELLGLHWRDIDLDKRIIHIKYTRDVYGIRRPKTPHSNRKFAILKPLANLLKKYKQDCTNKFSVDKNSLVILGKHGRPLIPEIIPRTLQKLLIESNLKELIGYFTPHSFRHLFASHLIRHGIDAVTVAKVLGHANPDITMKIYAQTAPGEVPDIDKIAKKLR